MGKGQNEQVTELEKIASSMERIATALEKIAGRTKRKSIGAIVYQLHKQNDTSKYSPEDIVKCIDALNEKFPGVVYPAEVTKLWMPKNMVSAFTHAIKPRPSSCAEHIVAALERAGFWDD